MISDGGEISSEDDFVVDDDCDEGVEREDEDVEGASGP